MAQTVPQFPEESPKNNFELGNLAPSQPQEERQYGRQLYQNRSADRQSNLTEKIGNVSQKVGTTAKAAGTGMELAGKATKTAARAAEPAGMAAGAGVGGAIGGVTGAIAGSVIPGAGTLAGAAAGARAGAQTGGKVGQGVGKAVGRAAEAGGQGLEKAGQTTKKIGEETKNFGSQLRERVNLSRQLAKQKTNDEKDNLNPYKNFQRMMDGIKLFTGAGSSVGDIIFSGPVFIITAHAEWFYSAFVDNKYKIPVWKKGLVVLVDFIIVMIVIIIATIVGMLMYAWSHPLETLYATFGFSWKAIKCVGGYIIGRGAGSCLD
ncbi:MAG: hypothetical protein RB292_00080 [Patescibacteria group bacterium]|jgi:hypothetical protein|nr:hypothetical protein [Patescibacteria group bacterium]